MKLPRLYPILDTGVMDRFGMDWEGAARILADAGAPLVQIRHKGEFTRAVFEKTNSLSRFCREAGVTLIVNDRADVAAIVGAGLHLGQDDLPAGAARRVLGTNPSLGLSTHNELQIRAAAAEPVDYVALGPVFQTGTKLNPDPVLGLDGVRTLRPLTDRPLVAIGGITLENVDAVLEAGADSVAVIGGLIANGSLDIGPWASYLYQ